jgi:succinate dehydrogenase/fumarate reductase flavoprotein subunit
MTVVAGAGMAGLVAAARLRQLGQPARVLEKGDRPGGSMLLSSGVVWRHRSLDGFRNDCPNGDPALQRLIVERLDDAIDWLERTAVTAGAGETGNPLTIGRRFDPRALTEALVRAAGEISYSLPVTTLPKGPVVLATGGFAAKLSRERRLPLRAAPWSEGDGLRLAREREAALAGDLDEFYGRALPAAPARVAEADFVRAAQLYGRFAGVVDDGGRPVFTGVPSWSENDLVQVIAEQPGGTAWYVLDAPALAQRVRERTVEQMIGVAEELGGEVRREASGRVRVKVVASVTHTLGGLRVDAGARVLRDDGTSVDGLYAAGVDAGGIASGGYASGLATALVLGLTAAESIAAA